MKTETPDNPLALHGPVGVRPGDRHFTHADGTPFFFLADTAWNGPLRSEAADWEVYLADRKAKGFSAIQFILAAPWAGCLTDREGQTAFEQVNGSLRPNEKFWARMDERVTAINRHGLLAVAVLAWAANFGESGTLNPGVSLSRRQLEQWVAYQVDRYRNHQMLWLLAGDGEYGGWRSWKWKSLGRKMFGSAKHAPVGLHPQGLTWPYRSFAGETWLDFFGYQSSHADDDRTARFILDGPPARKWPNIPKPIINLEPCYEGIHDWASGGVIDRARVRRAMYASLLNTPTVGVAYGAHGIWSWESQATEPLNHKGVGAALPWREAMELPGSGDVMRMRELFESVRWWELRPGSGVLAQEGNDRGWRGTISCAVSEQKDLALAYLPFGGEVRLIIDAKSSEWFDPRTGERRKVQVDGNGLSSHKKNAPSPYPSPRVQGEGKKTKAVTRIGAGNFTAPSEDDWILILRKT